MQLLRFHDGQRSPASCKRQRALQRKCTAWLLGERHRNTQHHGQCFGRLLSQGCRSIDCVTILSSPQRHGARCFSAREYQLQSNARLHADITKVAILKLPQPRLRHAVVRKKYSALKGLSRSTPAASASHKALCFRPSLCFSYIH